MPMSIRPVGEQINKSENESTNNNLFMMNLDAIAGAAFSGGFGKTSGFQVNAEATDADASLLLDLFNRCVIVSEAESLEEKKYAIPEDFSGDQVLRLKAASLVNGDTKIIRFTSKAARVIKTLVLSEQNAYTKSAVKKPYSVILAENKMNSIRQSTLAFSKTASVQVLAQNNSSIDQQYMPDKNSPYMTSHRLVKVIGTSNKQYIIRKFHVNDKYVVIAWNGRIGGYLAEQPKGQYDFDAEAQMVVNELLTSKRREGYRIDTEIEHGDLLGVPPWNQSATTEPTVTTKPTVTPKPTPTKQTPKKEEEISALSYEDYVKALQDEITGSEEFNSQF